MYPTLILAMTTIPVLQEICVPMELVMELQLLVMIITFVLEISRELILVTQPLEPVCLPTTPTLAMTTILALGMMFVAMEFAVEWAESAMMATSVLEMPWELIVVTQLPVIVWFLTTTILATMDMPALMMICVVMECVLVPLLYVAMETSVPEILWELIIVTRLLEHVSLPTTTIPVTMEIHAPVMMHVLQALVMEFLFCVPMEIFVPVTPSLEWTPVSMEVVSITYSTPMTVMI